MVGRIALRNQACEAINESFVCRSLLAHYRPVFRQHLRYQDRATHSDVVVERLVVWQITSASIRNKSICGVHNDHWGDCSAVLLTTQATDFGGSEGRPSVFVVV